MVKEKIFLIRHGKPAINMQIVIGSEEFSTWFKKYKNTSLDPFEKPPRLLKALLKDCRVLYVSSLKRSIESANQLSASKTVLSSSLFNEVSLSVLAIPYLKISLRAWVMMARIMWFFGLGGKVESFSKAKKRAYEAASVLIQASARYRQVAVIGHGFLNLLIGRVLLKQGWLGKKALHSPYWDCQIYELGPSWTGPDPP